eukprot:1160451-Pelagomonas_calceolata.AAC.17
MALADPTHDRWTATSSCLTQRRKQEHKVKQSRAQPPMWHWAPIPHRWQMFCAYDVLCTQENCLEPCCAQLCTIPVKIQQRPHFDAPATGMVNTTLRSIIPGGGKLLAV